MEDQVEKLKHFFERVHIIAGDDDGDDLENEGEYWELKDPDKVECWSLHMIPHTHNYAFARKYKDQAPFFPISYHEKIVNVCPDVGSKLRIICVTAQAGMTDDQQYHFTIVLDSKKIPFYVSNFIESLEPTEYRMMIKDLEKNVEEGYWRNPKTAANFVGKSLCFKLSQLFTDIAVLKGKIQIRQVQNTARSISHDPLSNIEGQGSLGTPGSQSSRGNRNTKQGRTPASAPRRSHLASSSGPRESGVEPEIEPEETSFVTALGNLPRAHDPDSEVNYEVSTAAYKNYWRTCTDAYIFNTETKMKLSINQLVNPPAEMNIRSHENRLAKDVMNYLWHMPDKSVKQVLCVMPVGCQAKPSKEDWERLKLGEFYIINGQHSVTASKLMVKKNLDETILKNFLEWDCYIVWSNSNDILRTISAYYNRVNHFVAMKPSWSTNIIGSRKVWEDMKCPRNSKDLAPMGTNSNVQRTADNRENNNKYKEFLKAMNERFAMLDVVKSQRASRGKNSQEKLKITNELKIITAPEHVYSLWSEVISSAAHGELMDPDTQMKFKLKPGWKSESGNLTHEFFKFLGNLSYDDLAKLATHILHQNPKPQNKHYPKVTIKAASSVLESCYTAKEWVERRKRKFLVKRELHLIDPELGLLNAFNEVIPRKWREFKASRSITSATMNVLLEQPGDDFFKDAKQKKCWNLRAVQISPYAAEFFRVFLERRTNFVKPMATANYRPYDIVNNRHSSWPPNMWYENILEHTTFGVFDFRYAPVVLNKGQCTPQMPYFYTAVTSLQKMAKPRLEDIPTWLFICADMVEQTQVLHFVQTNEKLKDYKLDYSEYWPAKNERMGNYSSSNSKATEKVYLIFLQDRSRVRSLLAPKSAYRAPNTDVFNKPRLYNELVYRINNTELRMEFFINILKEFSDPGMNVVSVFGGSKFTLAAMMTGHDVYAIGVSEETDTWTRIAKFGKSLDKNDFLPKGYFVDEDQHPRKPVPSGTPSSSRRKSSRRGRASQASFDDSESDDVGDEDLDADFQPQQLTPPVNPSQSVRGSSASSGQPPEGRQYQTPPPAATPRKRKRNDDDIDEKFERLMESLQKQRRSDRMQSFDAITSLQSQVNEMRSEINAQNSGIQNMQNTILHEINELKGIRPLASLNPASSNPLLLLQGLASGSQHSGESSLANPAPLAAVQPPVVPVPMVTDPVVIPSVSSPTPAPAPEPGVSSPLPPLPSEEIPPEIAPPLPDAPVDAGEREWLGIDAEIKRAAFENATIGGHPVELDMELERLGPINLDTEPSSLPGVEISESSEETESEDNLSFPQDTKQSKEQTYGGNLTGGSDAMHTEMPLIDPASSSQGGGVRSSLILQKQASDPPSSVREASISVAVPLRSRVTDKWLNVLLDLNGVLCVCEEAQFKGWAKKLPDAKQPHSATVPAVVGPKLVWVRPNCAEFLRELAEIARISIWSSMKQTTVEDVAHYLFGDQEGPFLVLGQNNCATFKSRDKSGYITTLKEPGTNKELFLKKLSDLFTGYKGKFTPENTIIVDDSPPKHILNKPENVVLPDTWSQRGNGPKDTFLLDVLLPWIKRLHLAREGGLQSFRANSSGKLGRRMLCDERNRREYTRLLDAVKLSPTIK